MKADLDRARAIFIEAIGTVPPDRWESFLSVHCADDTGLHHHVHQLLQAHVKAGCYLDPPRVEVDPTGEPVARTTEVRDAQADLREKAGAVIGNYKLLQPIGEGGMGSVWMAQQTDPVKRTVALKVVKPGMDTKEV